MESNSELPMRSRRSKRLPLRWVGLLVLIVSFVGTLSNFKSDSIWAWVFYIGLLVGLGLCILGVVMDFRAHKNDAAIKRFRGGAS